MKKKKISPEAIDRAQMFLSDLKSRCDAGGVDSLAPALTAHPINKSYGTILVSKNILVFYRGEFKWNSDVPVNDLALMIVKWAREYQHEARARRQSKINGHPPIVAAVEDARKENRSLFDAANAVLMKKEKEPVFTIDVIDMIISVTKIGIQHRLNDDSIRLIIKQTLKTM